MVAQAARKQTEEQQNDAVNVLGVHGVVEALGTLAPGAILEENALAKMFGRHPASIKRAVQRGELPPPTRLLGKPIWTAGRIVNHVEKRLEKAAQEGEKDAARIARLAP